MNLAAVRARLASLRGPAYWRSLEELADSPDFGPWLHREFPPGAAVWDESVDRRAFLRVMGAALALAGIGGCSAPPREAIVPYVGSHGDIVPGQPRYFATAWSLDGVGLGLLAESHQGRPVKVEGNPEHPASLGATDAFAQASILDLYDPDRAGAITDRGAIRSAPAFFVDLRAAAQGTGVRGEGLRVLTGRVTSPSLAAQLERLLAERPAARWHQWEPAGREDHAQAAARLAFGEIVASRYDLRAADVVLTLDSDLLEGTPSTLRHVREFALRRQVLGGPTMNRLYAVESAMTTTGASADHRLALRSVDVEPFARALARELGLSVAAGALPAATAGWLAAVAADLERHRGRSLVVPGERQPPAVHVLAHALNARLGNVGRTVAYAAPLAARPVDQLGSLRALVEDMAADRVRALLVVGGNPVYDAPADLDFDGALARVPWTAHLSVYANETSARCRWFVPETHYLESWADTRAWDGTVSIVQPLVAPMLGGISVHEVLAPLAGPPQASAYETVREVWRARARVDDFERFWREALHAGVVPDTRLPAREVELRAGWAEALGDPRPPGEGLEIDFRPDPRVWDGRFANNAWLQELPRPITTLTWTNAALLSPATAGRLGVGNEDVVELTHRGRRVQAPVWVMPGHADGAVTVHLGYGRRRAGRVGTGVGFDAYAIRTSEAPWFELGLAVRRTGQRRPLAATQSHHLLEGRALLRSGTLAELRARPAAPAEAPGHEPPPASLYPEYAYPGAAWGMAIDLTRCVGCSACVVACQAENNIPVVGEAQVRLGREMHWIRVDAYYLGGRLDDPRPAFMPVPCMHCEKAPCEVVCPVAATVHSAEGLNDMVYNRCVGTRYCSNNCPYKVRRFNFLQYAPVDATGLRLRANPDVTIRSRGVMEKCTYCVQRISTARIDAEREGRRIRDGEVTTACQQACPAQAIVFGDLNDPASRVRAWKQTPLDYALLGELNTRPRTSYLARIYNPNPALGDG